MKCHFCSEEMKKGKTTYTVNKHNYHLFIDEYQDVNPAQVELIKALENLHSKCTLFAVGDPRQTIYQWRGSDINRILEFNNDFEQLIYKDKERL